LIAPQTRRDLLANELVLIAPLDGPDKVALTAAGVAGALGGGRLAAGDPASVPAGRYAKSAFTALGLWDGLKDRLALADSVRAALLYVSRGETPLGVVYKTDANADGKVKIVARFPDKTHDPIHYPIALTASARPGSAEFLAYLGGAEAVRVFEKQGFVVLADK
jgi:molybdate transport system substrate-binding protein